MKGKYLQIILSIIMIISLLTVTVEALPVNDSANGVVTEESVTTDNSYNDTFMDDKKYIENSGLDSANDVEEIVLSDVYFTDGSVNEEYLGKKNVLVLNENNSVSYNFEISKGALYIIEITYLPLKGNGTDIELSLMIDNEYPFEACQTLTLDRLWIDAGKPSVDLIGNEYSSAQKEYEGYITRALYDINGVVTTPYEFALSEGTHTLNIELLKQGMALSSVLIKAIDNPGTYEEIIKNYDATKNYNGSPINIEGEKASIKSTRSLVAKSDNSSPEIYPSSAVVSKLNYIGGSTWKGAGDELIWNFSVPKSAYYKLGFSFKQNGVINGSVYRNLKIDGKSPFLEAQNVKFDYSSKWQFEQWGNGDNPYLLWLDEGEHTLSMAVTLGEIAPHYNTLKQLIFEIGELYLDIIMITGENPDTNRDYDLFKQIPNFSNTLEDFKTRLYKLSEEMQKVSGEKSNQYIAAFNNMARVIDSMIENPYTTQVYVADFYSQYTTLGSWVSEMVKMPLSLDRIQLCSPEKDFETNSKGFFARFYFGLQRFLVSFTEEYSRLTVNESSNKPIKIWINWGRDQAMVLNSLIQETFTPESGISVNLELTNASLIKGILSNTQPDLTLHLSRTEPINLAMRGAISDLSQFDDFDEVVKRFGASATVPYQYNGGVYALPDTQSFYIMFYRTDIFEELGLEVPNTWDEFLNVAANIQRNNMTVYLPYTQITSTTTVNTGVGGLNLFATILGQNGGTMYNEQLNACTLEEPSSLKAFKFWTEMYTKYKIPTTQSFYNRFKVGTCPLGIEAYTQYTQISEAAPEIAGCWDIALVPGTMQDDGSINRSVSGSGTGCAIIEKSKNKQAAWEFLKWWTSAETQLSYNNNVESILGTISRTTTATIDAFEQMSWENEDLEILKQQRSYIVEVPEVPGSYYLTRAVDQAFWQVIDGTYNAKDALVNWGEIANNEIARKIKQYS